MSSKYEPTSSGYREVDADDKDKAAITEAVTPEKKISGTEEESPKDKTSKKEKKAKGGKKGRGRTDPGTGKPATSSAVTDKNRKYPKTVGAEGGASGRQLAEETNYTIPYPEKGGHTVSQLARMETHKRKSILTDKDEEFVENYL